MTLSEGTKQRTSHHRSPGEKRETWTEESLDSLPSKDVTPWIAWRRETWTKESLDSLPSKDVTTSIPLRRETWTEESLDSLP